MGRSLSDGQTQGSMGRSSRRPGIYPDLRAIRQWPCFSPFGLLTGIISVILHAITQAMARAQRLEGMGRARSRGTWTRLLPLLKPLCHHSLCLPCLGLLEASSSSSSYSQIESARVSDAPVWTAHMPCWPSFPSIEKAMPQEYQCHGCLDGAASVQQ